MKRMLPAVLMFVLLATTQIMADNLIVRVASDSGPQSLRHLLTEARDGDVITFELPVGENTISLKSELYVSGKSITIDGRNLAGKTAEPVTLQVRLPGLSPFRVFNIQPGKGHTVTLMHLKLRGGDISNVRTSHDGGAILAGNTGSLILIHCVVRDGKARRGGGLYAGGPSRIDVLRLEHCVIMQNESIARKSASAGGGVYISFGKAVISSTRIHDNVSGTHSGGICLDNASGVFVDSDIAGNYAKDARSRDGSFTGPTLFFCKTSLNIPITTVTSGTQAALTNPPVDVMRVSFPRQANGASSSLLKDVEPISQLLLLKGVRDPHRL